MEVLKPLATWLVCTAPDGPCCFLPTLLRPWVVPRPHTWKREVLGFREAGDCAISENKPWVDSGTPELKF